MLQWVINSGLCINEIWTAIFIVLTPDGIEDEYFNIFHDHIRNKGYAIGSAEYWLVTANAEEFIETVVGQYVYGPAFEYVIRGLLVDVTVNDDTIVLTVSYEE